MTPEEKERLTTYFILFMVLSIVALCWYGLKAETNYNECVIKYNELSEEMYGNLPVVNIDQGGDMYENIFRTDDKI